MRRDKMLREMQRMKSSIRHMEKEGELRALGYEDKMRDDMNTMHQLEIDRVTGTTLAERNTARENNLEQIYPNKGGYGFFGDPSLYKNQLDEVYRVYPDGTKRKLD